MKDVKFDFSGKRFVVVGASSGIGRQVTYEICRSGGSVLAIARNLRKLDEIKALCEERIIIQSIDVREKDSLKEVVAEQATTQGKFHGSVYTAGVSKTTVLRSYNQDEANNVMDVNFWGWINLMSVLCRKKYSEEDSSHVVISSVAAKKGETGNFAYNASKASIDTCVRTFAKELSKRRCRINTVSPGFIVSSLTEDYFTERGFSEEVITKHLLGLGTPEDVSGLILYLLSDRARWITGSDFVIDGGYLISD